MRRLHPTEYDEQVAVMQWKQFAMRKYPELALLHHCPNGGSRHPAEAARLKRAGVMPGIPDLFLPVARGGYHGAYVEMKRHGGKNSAGQLACQDALREQGYFVYVAWSAQAAIGVFESYLKLTK